jgi:hypothetical protein
MKPFRIPLRVVFYQEEGQWVAHCLEFDLCGDGPDKESALDSLAGAIRIQLDESIRQNNPRNLFSPADSETHEKFFAGKDTAHLELTLDDTDPVVIEQTEFREYVSEPDRNLATA